MPRHPRVHAKGLLYHVIARGNDGQKIFLRQSDCQAFIARNGAPLYVSDLRIHA